MRSVSRRSLVLGGLAAGLAPAGLAAVPKSAGAQGARRTLKVATVGTSGGPWHLGLLRFKDEVEAASKGRIAVSVFADGQLGDNSQLFSALQLGTLDFNYAGLSAALVLKGGGILNLLYVPYLFKSREAAERAANSDEFKGFYDRIAAESGVRVAGVWGNRSPRALQTTRGPITVPADVKGLRIRIPPYDILRATFAALDAQSVPLGWLELYTALSRGTVDGQENGFDLSTPARFYEVAKYWSATDQTFESVAWFTSDRLWKSLSADDRDLLLDAAQKAGLATTAATEKIDRESIAILKANGATYVEPDVDAFRKRLADVHKPFDGKLWPEGTIERIRASQS